MVNSFVQLLGTFSSSRLSLDTGSRYWKRHSLKNFKRSPFKMKTDYIFWEHGFFYYFALIISVVETETEYPNLLLCSLLMENLWAKAPRDGALARALSQRYIHNFFLLVLIVILLFPWYNLCSFLQEKHEWSNMCFRVGWRGCRGIFISWSGVLCIILKWSVAGLLLLL